MDEAERLCDRVAIIDHGKVIALGSPARADRPARRRARRRVRPRRRRPSSPEPDGLRRPRLGPRGAGRGRRLLADRRRAAPGDPRPARRARRPGPPAGPADDPARQPGRRLRRPDRPPPPRRRRPRRPAGVGPGGRRRRGRATPGPSRRIDRQDGDRQPAGGPGNPSTARERRDASQLAVLPALPGPAPRVLSPAGADLLGLRVPDRPGHRAWAWRSRAGPPSRSRSTWSTARSPAPSSRRSRTTTRESPRARARRGERRSRRP